MKGKSSVTETNASKSLIAQILYSKEVNMINQEGCLIHVNKVVI